MPVVYHTNGGSIPEYCDNYGLGFENFDQMITAILTIKQDYKRYKESALRYKNDVSKVIGRYVEIINETL